MALARAVWTFIDTRDRRIMRRVHRWRAPRWVRIGALLATRLGDGWVWYALGIVLALAGGPERFRALASAGCAVVSGILIFRCVKNLSRRQRPCELEPHCWAVVLPPDQFSFPSGHSITAFAVAVSVGLYYPHLQAELLVLALSIAISRVLLGMHFLSDVVAGSLLGTALGLAGYFLFA
ncbi:MAG: phosphatase PAP2 family protein [Candidatus Acidiferrales bacterium]